MSPIITRFRAWRLSGLMRDGAADPNSRDQIFSGVNGNRKPIFPVQLTTNRIRNHILFMPNVLRVITTETHLHVSVRHLTSSLPLYLFQLEIPEGLGGYQVEAEDGSQVVTLVPTEEPNIDGRQRRVDGGILDEGHSARRYDEGYTPR